ncbi:MAG: hypothetical protein ACRDF4_00090 [Rhabdochlamydiaceae bacterium]
MENILDPIQAKQFFISKIVEEARRSNQSLTQLEEKMLWFTECGSDAKPEYLDACAEFDEKYDSGSYEEKSSRLLKAAYDRDIQNAPERQRKEVKRKYLDARDALNKEDHYLSVMVKNIFGSSLRSQVSLLRMLFTGPKKVSG